MSRTPSKAEVFLSKEFREILAPLPVGAAIPESPEFRSALGGVEWFVPEVLGEIFPYWQTDCLDGVLPDHATKTAELEAEIFGVAWVMNSHGESQGLTPIHVRFQIAESADEISWFECRVGEVSKNGMMISENPGTKSFAERGYYNVAAHAGKINWMYRAGYGERR